MLKKLEKQSRRWSVFVTFIDFVIIVLIVGLGGVFIIHDTVGTVSLILSIAIAHITTIRPLLRKPRLKMFIDEIRCSAPTLEGDTASWFIRFGIMNFGLTAAKACVGRIISVWTESGEQLEKFDPLTLFWARQDNTHTGFSPVDIQGYGDVEYLDIAQIKKRDSVPLEWRVVLKPPMSLTKGDTDSASPGSEPVLRAGTYYIQIAIYAEEANIPARWFEITCSEKVSECGGPIPCDIKEKRPKFVN